MMNHARLFSLGLLLLLAPLAPAQAGKTTTVAVGSAQIRLQAPDGFTEIGQDSAEIMARFTTFTPPSNKLLAVYVTDADARRLRAGQSMELNTYIMVQTHRQSLSTDMSPAEFNNLRDIIRNQQKELLERGKTHANELLRERRSQISTQAGSDLNLSVQDMALKGVFVDNERIISLAAVNRYNVQSEGRPVSFEVAGASSVIHVRNKSLFVYVFEKYENNRNLENVRNISKAWGRQILRDNGAR